MLPGALGAGSNVLLTSNLPGMEEEVDTFADTVIIVDDDTPASDLHQLRSSCLRLLLHLHLFRLQLLLQPLLLLRSPVQRLL